MRIALYYPWVYLTSGVERTMLEIVKRSRHDWTIYTNHFDAENTYPEFKDVKLIELPGISVKRDYSNVLSGAIRILFQKLNLNGFDLLMVSCDGLGDLITFRNHEKPVICFCHTPLRPVFDLSYKERHLQKRCGFWHKMLFGLFGFIFKHIDRRVWRYYIHVFCNSEETKKRVVNGGLYPAKKIEVLHPGIDVKRMRPSYRYERYFFLPGRIMWTKNIELGIRSFKLFHKRYPEFSDFRLVVAGIVDEKSRTYFRHLQDLADGGSNIGFICSPSDQELCKLYQECYLTLFTAFNEDWGIVPLEAMAFAKPVIAVNKGGPTESIADKITGFLVDPNPETFSETMFQLASNKDLVLKMGKEGRKTSKRYDWGNFVGRIDNVLDKLQTRNL